MFGAVLVWPSASISTENFNKQKFVRDDTPFGKMFAGDEVSNLRFLLSLLLPFLKKRKKHRMHFQSLSFPGFTLMLILPKLAAAIGVCHEFENFRKKHAGGHVNLPVGRQNNYCDTETT